MHIYFIYMYISIFSKKIISLSYFNLNSVKFIIWKTKNTRIYILKRYIILIIENQSYKQK